MFCFCSFKTLAQRPSKRDRETKLTFLCYSHYTDMWWEKVGWTKLKGIKVRLIRCWTNAKWIFNAKYDFTDHVTDAYTQKTYKSPYYYFFSLNKSECESVNSAIFCPVLGLLVLCLRNRNHWDASTRHILHKNRSEKTKKP